MAKIGYARVSSSGQSVDIQLKALEAYGCDIIRSEKVSAASLIDRDELQTILQFLRSGDSLVVTKLDRLARSMLDLMHIMAHLTEVGAHLVALNTNIDTSSPTGRAFVQMLGVFAEFENEIRRERQAEGIAKAKANGVYARPKPVRIPRAEIAEFNRQGMGATQIGKLLGIHRNSVYRILHELNGASHA